MIPKHGTAAESYCLCAKHALLLMQNDCPKSLCIHAWLNACTAKCPLHTALRRSSTSCSFLYRDAMQCAKRGASQCHCPHASLHAGKPCLATHCWRRRTGASGNAIAACKGNSRRLLCRCTDVRTYMAAAFVICLTICDKVRVDTS